MTDDRCDQIAKNIERPERLQVILSSETMNCIDDFKKFEDLKNIGIDPIFSLDRKGESTITQPGELANRPPLELVQHAYRHGARNLILLDLDSVGTMSGISSEIDGLGALIQEITSELSDIKLISGGGVGNAMDVQAFLDCGCQHVLVASAIHECRLTPDDVSQLRVIGESA